MKALYLPGDVDSVFSDMDACRGPIRMLLELAEEFSDVYKRQDYEGAVAEFDSLIDQTKHVSSFEIDVLKYLCEAEFMPVSYTHLV